MMPVTLLKRAYREPNALSGSELNGPQLSVLELSGSELSKSEVRRPRVADLSNDKPWVSWH